MGTFGVDVYSQARFGKDPAASRPDFSVQPFTSTPLDYRTLFLTWANPVSTDCHQLQLVRNGLNLPQDETDGEIVFNEPVQVITSWVEVQASPGFNYYSMFGCDTTTNKWVRCSDLIALLPINWGLGDRMYDLLPSMYKDQDIVLVDPYNPYPSPVSSNVAGAPPLQRFISLLGFQLDYLRTELESLMSVNDSQHCSGALLPLLATQLGMPYEIEMGMQQARTLITNAVHLYRIKGTNQGLSEYSSMLTGYASVPVHAGNNKLLNTDDSVCAKTIGSWEAWPPDIPTGVGTTTTQVFPAIGGENAGLSLTQVPDMTQPPYSIPSSVGLIGFTPPNFTNSGMAIRVTGASTADICTARIATLDFLPPAQTTPGNVTWTFQIYTPFGTPSRTVTASVVGDRGTAVPIVLGTSSHPTTAGQWVQMTVTAAVLPPYNADGTPNYFWIYPRIQIAGMAANETHYYTLGMFWNLPPSIVAQQPAYDYPRDLKIILEPMQTNLLANPLTTFIHGLDGVSGYDGISGGTNTSSLSIAPVPVGQAPSAVDCANVTPPGPPFGGNELHVAPTTTNAIMWSGSVNNINTPPWTPKGWWVNPGVDGWFPGAQQGYTASKDWWDATNNLFAVPPDSTGAMSYFGTGFGQISGQWFRQPQPPAPSDALPFSVAPLQWFTFSVYAKYLQLFVAAGATMVMGMRWLYPDGTHQDNYDIFTLTDSYDVGNGVNGTGRYYVSYAAPYETLTTIAPNQVIPYIQFPDANLTPSDIYALNGAMFYPGHTAPPQSPAPYMDTTVSSPGDSNYSMDTHGASYYYKRKAARTTRLAVTLSDWVPMGATYTWSAGAGAVQPPWIPA